MHTNIHYEHFGVVATFSSVLLLQASVTVDERQSQCSGHLQCCCVVQSLMHNIVHSILIGLDLLNKLHYTMSHVTL